MFPIPNPPGTGLPNPASYTDNNDGSISDNVTGLIWEKSPTQTADQCSGPESSCSPDEAKSYCAAKGGSWRLPARRELVTLVDYTVAVPGPTINQTSFPNTEPSTYWTSTPFTGSMNCAWFVSFGTGETYYDSDSDNCLFTTYYHYVRCVRSDQPHCSSTHFAPQANGVVYDAYTGLYWQQDESSAVYALSDAPSVCTSPWRLPSANELLSITDQTKGNPAVDLTAFPTATSDRVWTATPYAGQPGHGWQVSFDWGYTDGDFYSSPMYKVRCVHQ